MTVQVPVRVAVAMLGCLLLCGSAAAQEQNRFAVGISFNEKAVTNAIARGNDGVGINWRIGHDKTGWGWHYGFGWYSANLEDPSAPQRTIIGELRVRPLMAGYGYTWVRGRYSMAATAIGGYAITTVRSLDETHELRLIRHGTPVVKPEINGWVDLTRAIGLNVNVGYIVARPRYTSSGTEQSFRADTLSLTAGIVYRLF